jgi:hypothetical protein
LISSIQGLCLWRSPGKEKGLEHFFFSSFLLSFASFGVLAECLLEVLVTAKEEPALAGNTSRKKIVFVLQLEGGGLSF